MLGFRQVWFDNSKSWVWKKGKVRVKKLIETNGLKSWECYLYINMVIYL